jgi:2-haloacid dehalogenase
MQLYKTVIFDLGAVLIDWNPDYLYKKLFASDDERKWFYQHICTPDWNEEQDAGRPLDVATEMLVSEHPANEKMIRAYYTRWEEMLNGPIDGTVEILKELKEKEQYQLLALTNWSAETFPIALGKYDFLHWFHGRVVSGEEKTRKPFVDIYKILLNRYKINPQEAVFVDDNMRNLIPAAELGIKTIHFTSSIGFRKELVALGIL